jgi:hypothetical protein
MRTLWHSDSSMLAPLLTAVILLGYAGSLWWLLHRESALVVVGLAALCMASLCARVVYTTQYPAGFNEDEVKQFGMGVHALDTDQLFGLGVQGPILLKALFESQLLPWLGTSRWAIRGYSIACSVLATAAAFAAARVETRGAVVAQKPEGFGRMDFRVSPGDDIRVFDYTLGYLPRVLISLMGVTPAAQRLPLWGSVSPLPVEDGGGETSGG